MFEDGIQFNYSGNEEEMKKQIEKINKELENNPLLEPEVKKEKNNLLKSKLIPDLNKTEIYIFPKQFLDASEMLLRLYFLGKYSF